VQAFRQDTTVVPVVADLRHRGARLADEGVAAVDHVVDEIAHPAHVAALGHVENAHLEVAERDAVRDAADLPEEAAQRPQEIHREARRHGCERERADLDRRHRQQRGEHAGERRQCSEAGEGECLRERR
jgi:hypothetical protein